MSSPCWLYGVLFSDFIIHLICVCFGASVWQFISCLVIFCLDPHRIWWPSDGIRGFAGGQRLSAFARHVGGFAGRARLHTIHVQGNFPSVDLDDKAAVTTNSFVHWPSNWICLLSSCVSTFSGRSTLYFHSIFVHLFLVLIDFSFRKSRPIPSR